MYSPKNRKLQKFLTTYRIFFKLTPSNMRYHKTYMYINFQQNRVSISVKTLHTHLFAKNCKLHKFANCNYNFEKSRLSDMHYPITGIQANFGISRPIRYQYTTKRNYFYRRQTDGHTDGQTSCTTTIVSLVFFKY